MFQETELNFSSVPRRRGQQATVAFLPVDGEAANVSTIAGLVAEGSGITITGDGTADAPYIITSEGGGGGMSQPQIMARTMGC